MSDKKKIKRRTTFTRSSGEGSIERKTIIAHLSDEDKIKQKNMIKMTTSSFADEHAMPPEEHISERFYALVSELLALKKACKHVLLYGNDTYMRKRLACHMQEKSGCSFFYLEHLGGDSKIYDYDNFLDYLDFELLKAIENKDHKRVCELFSINADNLKTINIVDCRQQSGEIAYEKLTAVVEYTTKELMNGLSVMDKNNHFLRLDAYYVNSLYPLQYVADDSLLYSDDVRYRCGSLLRRMGVTFIDNLACDLNDLKNKKYYEKLALRIEEDAGAVVEETDNKLVKYLPRWLVAYTYDPTTFPEYFLKQFELVPLDDSEAKQQKKDKAIVTHISETAKPEKQHEGKTAPFYKKTPVGAKWQDLTMSFPNHLEDKADIIFKDKGEDTISLKDLGFADRKATKTFKALESLILLKKIAETECNCIASSENASEGKRMHAQVESLRSTLKRCFGIDDDPVPANKSGGYRLLFTANCYDIKEKQEVDTYIVSLKEYISELKQETNNSGDFRDNERIKIVKESVQAVAKEITQRTPNTKIKDVICTGCYEKIPTYILSNDNFQILCSDCMPETASEYESKSVIDHKDNDIPRSNKSEE